MTVLRENLQLFECQAYCRKLPLDGYVKSNLIVKYLLSFCHCVKHVFVLSKKVKGSRYRPSVAQRVGRGTALFFHDRGTRRG